MTSVIGWVDTTSGPRHGPLIENSRARLSPTTTASPTTSSDGAAADAGDERTGVEDQGDPAGHERDDVQRRQIT